MAQQWRKTMMKQLMKSGSLNRGVKPAIREAQEKTRWNIVRGDLVQVIGRHPESGKQGIVKEMIRQQDRLIVTGVNMKSKRLPGIPEKGIKGATLMEEASIHYSNVNLVDPVTNAPTRIIRKVMEDGTRVRVSKASGAIIPKPVNTRRKPLNAVVTADCTSDEDAWEITYPYHPQPQV